MNSKGHDWIAALPQLTATEKKRWATKATVRPLAPGTSFQFEEEPAKHATVTLAGWLPTHTLGIHVWIPPVLQDQLQEVTRGASRSTILAALADRACERIQAEKLAIVATGIPDQEEARKVGRICHFDISLATEPSFTVDGHVTPIGAWKHKRERRRVPVPEDTRQSIHDLVRFAQGPKSLSRSTLMLAQWALVDLQERKRWLVVR